MRQMSAVENAVIERFKRDGVLSTETFNYFQALGLGEQLIINQEKLKLTVQDGLKQLFSQGIRPNEIKNLFATLAETQLALIAFVVSLGVSGIEFDQYVADSINAPEVAHTWLRDKVDEMLSGKPAEIKIPLTAEVAVNITIGENTDGRV